MTLARQSFAGSVMPTRGHATGKGTTRTTERDFSSNWRTNMNKLMTSARNFLREEDGVTAIEYGLLAALIAVAIIVGANLVGQRLNNLFTTIAGCLGNLPAACVL